MKSVALHNLGCKVNGYEMDVMQQMLQEKGYKIVPFDERADIYIINTCTVTNIADRKSRQMLHRAKKQNPEAVVVAVGCYVETGKEQALKDTSIDLAIGNDSKTKLPEILECFLSQREGAALKDRQGEGEAPGERRDAAPREKGSALLKRTAEHTRAFLKIQDGCNQFCSYCIIPYARGRVRSRREEEILKEITLLAENGYKEVVLTGIHISSYGMDLKEAPCEGSLISLIGKIQEIDGIERIRLGSLEPRIITGEFVRALSGMEKVCPHFHLSLQSGSNSVLKRMNRKYTAEEYYDRVGILREYFDDPAITTDVIVGFPGETEKEFQETRELIEKVGFYEIHVFKYSLRKGTAAAKMAGQIPEEIKAGRSGELIALSERLAREYRQAHLHKETEVLFEEEKLIGDQRWQIGHTREYIKAACRTKEPLSGKLLTGKLTEFLSPELLIFELSLNSVPK